jgi:hypothetical protein
MQSQKRNITLQSQCMLSIILSAEYVILQQLVLLLSAGCLTDKYLTLQFSFSRLMTKVEIEL